MDRVITKEMLTSQNVSKYKFKVLAIGGHADEAEEAQAYTRSEPLNDEATPTTSSRDELVESLLKKTDEISSNFIKIQMKLEEQEAVFKEELEKVKKEAYDQGFSDGKQACETELEHSKTEGIEQFAKSVRRLNESAEEFVTALEGIRQELTLAALDIAKEVIEDELHEHSNAIAKKLSSALIAELSSASEITLRVNPNDHGAVSERVSNLDHVTVISDSAVSPGGVIAISDVGNINSEIMKRYERIKKAALSG